MIQSTNNFQSVLKAARRVSTPLIAIRTFDPASTIQIVAASVRKADTTPILQWDIIRGLGHVNEAGKKLVAQMLDPDELLARFVDGAEELVELGLHRRGIAILAVLDQEHHQEGDDGRAGIDDQLPGVGIMKQGTGGSPDQDRSNRDAEGKWVTGTG